MFCNIIWRIEIQLPVGVSNKWNVVFHPTVKRYVIKGRGYTSLSSWYSYEQFISPHVSTDWNVIFWKKNNITNFWENKLKHNSSLSRFFSNSCVFKCCNAKIVINAVTLIFISAIYIEGVVSTIFQVKKYISVKI